MTAPVLIVGVGNELLGDEGVGVHVARRLAAFGDRLSDGVDVLEAGTSILDAVIEMSRYSRVYVVDAMRGGQAPGTVYRLDELGELAKLPDSSVSLSLHDWGVRETLQAARLLGLEPQCLTLIGAEPASTAMRTELSPEVQRAAEKIVALLLNELGPHATTRPH
jgi:hydrogenase maturation protease